VDRHLAEENRLILIENVGEVFSKIALNRRNRDVLPDGKNRLALDSIVQNIVKVMEHECQTQAPKAR
jgi:hypothetical protein